MSTCVGIVAIVCIRLFAGRVCKAFADCYCILPYTRLVSSAAMSTVRMPTPDMGPFDEPIRPAT